MFLPFGTAAASGAVSSLRWDQLASATAALTLSNAGNGTTFNQTSAVNWIWANITAATNVASQSSPILHLTGTYWGGSASATDSWTIQNKVSNGTNGASTLTLSHSGSSGQATVSIGSGIIGLPSQGSTSFNNGYLWTFDGSWTSSLTWSGQALWLYDTNTGHWVAGFQQQSTGNFGARIMNTGVYQWSGGSAGSSGADTGLSRTAAGVVAVGNGAQGDTSGTLNAATLVENTTLSPTSAATAGVTGQIAWDVNNVYVCTNGGGAGSATWKKAALTTV